MRDPVTEANEYPFDHELFLELVEVARDALTGKRREIPPDAERCLEDMQPGWLYLTDVPMNQMGMSIVGECMTRFTRPEGEALSVSFMFRWFAVGRAVRRGRLREFIIEDDDGQPLIHGAVYAAAADCPLDEDGNFDASFEDRIRGIIAEDEIG